MSIPSPTVDQFSDYIRHLKSDNTARSYRRSVDLFLDFCAKNGLPENNLPPNILSLFSDYLMQKKMKAGTPQFGKKRAQPNKEGALYSPASIRSFLAGVRKWLEWLRMHGHIQGDAFLNPELPKISYPNPNSLTQKQIVGYLQLSARLKEPARTALLLAPFCGLRNDELVHLQMKNLRKIVKNGKTHVTFTVKGKGDKVRMVPILPDGVPLLFDYLKTWRRHYNLPASADWLFPNPRTKTPIDPRGLRYHVHRIAKTLGATRTSMHTLRRTYATTLKRAGMPMIELQKVLGHEKADTTIKSYIEVTDEELLVQFDKTGAKLVDTSKHGLSIARAQRKALEGLADIPTVLDTVLDSSDDKDNS